LGLSSWAHQILKNNIPNHKSMTMSNLPKPNTQRRNKHGKKWDVVLREEIQIKNVPQTKKKCPSQGDYVRINRYIFGCVVKTTN